MYSTAKEVHVAIASKLYQINTNRKRTIREEEIDEAFNTVMFKFIEERSIISPHAVGLDETVKRQDDLKDLKISRQQVMIQVKPTTPLELGRFVYAVLPYDYYKFEALELNLNYKCGRGEEDVHTVNNNAFFYRMGYDDAAATADYSTEKVKVDGAIIYDAAANNVTIHNKASKFITINNILQSFKSLVKNVGIYWENYGDIYKKDSFIIISDSSITVSFERKGTEITVPILPNLNESFDYIPNLAVPCELVQAKLLPDMRRNIYEYRNRHLKPLIELENNKLRIDYNPQYLPIIGYMTYIKRPILLNLKLDIMTDFTSHIGEIIDLTVTNLQRTMEGKQGLEQITNQNVQ